MAFVGHLAGCEAYVVGLCSVGHDGDCLLVGVGVEGACLCAYGLRLGVVGTRCVVGTVAEARQHVVLICGDFVVGEGESALDVVVGVSVVAYHTVCAFWYIERCVESGS